MPKVLISDNLSERAREIFEIRGVDVDVKIGLSAEELAAIIPDYDGLAIRSATKVRADILEKASRLKVVGRAGIGVDNVDVPAATAKGVVVMNTPFGNSITTAEHAIAMMFALAREIPQANESTHAGKWEKSRFMGVELTAKTLGVIGCGNIGAIVADRGVGLRMKVVAFDPFLSDEKAAEIGVEKVDFDTLLARADFITIHTPLNDKTRGLLDAAAFKKMKKGVRIINCARGGIIVEQDLAAALDSGHVAGAALDVFETEPATENVLFGRDNVICTPHLGAATSEAQENVAIQVAEQMADFLMSGAVTNALNMPSMTAEDAVRLKPYMSLAKDLGSLVGQITQSSISEIKISYEGDAAKLNFKALTSQILTAVLSPSLEQVNMVNAPIVAKERGIKVTEAQSDQLKDYSTLITIELVTDNQTRSVSGTLLGHVHPRLVMVSGVPIEAEITPHMLYVHNNDKPGFIGAMGTIMGNEGVNIAYFNLGRKKNESSAIALLSLDEPISKTVIEKIKGLDHTIQVQALSFDA